MVDPLPLSSTPMAFISDVHGNLPALEAVLGELERDGITAVYAAGDHLLGGDDPLDVWRRLQSVGAFMTRGVGDAALVRIDPDDLHPATLEEQTLAARFTETRDAIGDLIVEQLRRLPETLRVPLVDGSELVLVHGSPADPMAEMSHDLSDEELVTLLGNDPADVIVCGGTHVPFQRQLEGVLVVNVGSVGQAPEGRVAHYTVVSPKMEGPDVRAAWIDY